MLLVQDITLWEFEGWRNVAYFLAEILLESVRSFYQRLLALAVGISSDEDVGSCGIVSRGGVVIAVGADCGC